MVALYLTLQNPENPLRKKYFFLTKVILSLFFHYMTGMDYSPEYELRILPEIRCGNQQAYQSLFYYYYQRLYHYALTFTSDQDKAEDIVQEVFVKLWKKRESLYPNGSLKAYLYRMTYNQFIDGYKKEKRYHEELAAFKSHALTPLLEESEESWQLKLSKLKEAIDNLPPRCREIFLLHKQEGIPQKEIAKKLDISVKTVENQVGKALNILKNKLTSKVMTLLMLIRKPFKQR